MNGNRKTKPGRGCFHFPVDIQFSYCYNNPIDYHTAGKSHLYDGLLNADGIEDYFSKYFL
jgi:hypothetical protein